MRHLGLVSFGALVLVLSASGQTLAAPPVPATTAAPAKTATAPTKTAAGTTATTPAAPAPTTTTATTTAVKPGTKDAAKPAAKDAKTGAKDAAAGSAAAGTSGAVPPPPPAADPPPPPPVEEPPPPPPPLPPPPPPPPPPQPEAPPQKKVAFEIGAGVGLDISTGALSVGPNIFLDVGARFHIGPGFLAAAVRGGYQRYTASGTGSIPCAATTTTACISANNGAYAWDLVEETVTIGLPISYRLFPDKRIHPYVGVQPQVFLLRATTTSFGLENSQGDTKFGFAGLLGGQFDVGPGGVFLEAGFQYVGLEHRLTGKSNLGAVTIGLGYRIAL